MSSIHASRRRFLLQIATGAVATPLLATVALQAAEAAELPHLPLDNPTAKALGYVEEASKATHASYKPGSLCANCKFIQGADGEAYRPCQLFAGFSVSSQGWCSAWAAK